MEQFKVMKCYKYSENAELIKELNICSCGTAEVCYAWVLEYLRDLKNNNLSKYKYDSPDWKFIQIINGFLDEKGFVEHGVSCRCSWLTEKGEKLLLALEYMAKFNFELEETENNPDLFNWWYVEEE